MSKEHKCIIHEMHKETKTHMRDEMQMTAMENIF